MSGAFNSPVHKRRPSINVTPLIDVMFLLLIFFMVSSTFKSEYAIDVTLPEAATATAEETDTHEITISESGDFYLDGVIRGVEELRADLVRLKREEPLSNLVVRTDEAARAGRLIDILDLFRELKIKRMVIPTVLRESPGDR